MNFSTVFVIALVCFVQTAFCQVIGIGSALNRYGIGNNCNSNSANSVASNVANGISGAGASDAGIGYGSLNIDGELPVSGQTKVIGNLPVIGFVTFEGHLPAGGMVSLAEGCNGGNQPYY